MLPLSCDPRCSVFDSVRTKLAGVPVSRSPSELNVNVPELERLASDVNPSRIRLDVSLRVCRLSRLNHAIELESCSVRSVEFASTGFAPNDTERTDDPSGRAHRTGTMPSGIRSYGPLRFDWPATPNVVFDRMPKPK